MSHDATAFGQGDGCQKESQELQIPKKAMYPAARISINKSNSRFLNAHQEHAHPRLILRLSGKHGSDVVF